MKIKNHLDKIFILLFIVIFLIVGYINREKEIIDNTELIEEENESISENETDLEQNLNSQMNNETTVQNENIYVDVSGCVTNPGVYELKNNQRIFEAVEKAGGFCKEVDLESINMSLILHDEMKIHIYKKGEKSISSSDINNSQLVLNDKDNKVNINTADKNLLMTIPGIGEVKADEIINYRKENKFNTIEDIKNISGIGDKTFEKLKEYIVVN